MCLLSCVSTCHLCFIQKIIYHFKRNWPRFSLPKFCRSSFYVITIIKFSNSSIQTLFNFPDRTSMDICKVRPEKYLFVFAWKAKRFVIASLLLLFPTTFRNNREFGSKIYFTDHGTANTIQLFVAIKGLFSCLFFFWTSRCEGEFPRDLMVTVSTC